MGENLLPGGTSKILGSRTTTASQGKTYSELRVNWLADILSDVLDLGIVLAALLGQSRSTHPGGRGGKGAGTGVAGEGGSGSAAGTELCGREGEGRGAVERRGRQAD